MRKRLLSFLVILHFCAGIPVSAQEIPSPESIIGHKVGEDRKLAAWPQVVDYFQALAAASPRISLQVAGKSTLGNDMILIAVTSEANQAQLDHYRGIANRLAAPYLLSESDAQNLIAEGKAIALITGTIHSTEVASTQMFMEFAYDMATTEDPEVLGWLDDAILLIFPSINPDGQEMVIDWYNRYLDTEYEGGPMPWLYHHYIGHDNNRDFYMLTQKETQVVNDVLYHRWLPQVFLDEHQMGSTGPRLFVPPQTNPLSLRVDSMIFRLADSLGTRMGLRLEQAGKKGVGHDMIYDSYWPGGTRNTAWWKNVVGLLTEAASVNIASPVYIEPNELQGGRKGFPEYNRRSNFPSPWEGGWWRLRDIVDYELIATRAYLEGVATHRKDILENFYRMNRAGIDRGKTEAPYAFVIPAKQHDTVAAARMIEILLRGGVRVETAEEDFWVGNTRYREGTIIVPASQPYREFALEMLQRQRYPEVKLDAEADIVPPYDVTSWSLPISMGVDVVRIEEPFKARSRGLRTPPWPGKDIRRSGDGYRIRHSADTVFIALNLLLGDGERELYWVREKSKRFDVGDIYIPSNQASAEELSRIAKQYHVPIEAVSEKPSGAAYQVGATRVGLFKPWAASMDEGWTRWLLEQYSFPFESLTNEMMKEGAFKDSVDVVVLPDISPVVIREGRSKNAARFRTAFPPEYQGGIGSEGEKALKEWVEQGGTLVALDSSTEFAMDLFNLPVTNVLKGVNSKEFSAPGSMLRMYFDTDHPLAYGMREEEAGYFSNSPAFQTRLPRGGIDRRVVATYPEHDDEILVSGYIRGAEKLEKRSAVVEFKVGEGRVVLIGFRAQHRAQPHRTFKLFFNSLFLPTLKETTLP